MMLATVTMKVMKTPIMAKDRMMSKNGQCRDCRNWVRPSRILQDCVLQRSVLFTAALGTAALGTFHCSAVLYLLQRYTLFIAAAHTKVHSTVYTVQYILTKCPEVVVHIHSAVQCSAL